MSGNEATEPCDDLNYCWCKVGNQRPLSGPSAAERDIVTEAIEVEEGYIIPPDEALPDAFRGLAERFRPQELVPDGG